MDLNLAVFCGRLAAPPEVRSFDSGTRLVRYLLTVRSEQPRRRVDVLPVTLWDPPEELVEDAPAAGSRLWVVGAIQRRFWDGVQGRRSRLEIIADQVTVRLDETALVP
ncbi:MAG: single-stranded DNA-binding protein [Gammaproteobacteria bacterium]|nr:single-stranded DNA-binding protein [Gammaproteobacteria bacterium]